VILADLLALIRLAMAVFGGQAHLERAERSKLLLLPDDVKQSVDSDTGSCHPEDDEYEATYRLRPTSRLRHLAYLALLAVAAVILLSVVTVRHLMVRRSVYLLLVLAKYSTDSSRHHSVHQHLKQHSKPLPRQWL
jgi:hypothetical protein